MKVQPLWSMNKNACDIDTAIADACEDDRSGVAESGLASARATGALLGKLVEMLRVNGALDDKDVLRLLPGWEQAE